MDPRIKELRETMGTGSNRPGDLKTEFVHGVEGITVDLVDWPVNPYKAMFIMATTCWGKSVNKWAGTTPENRYNVIKAVLEGQALPLALEAPQFTFVIEGPSRSAFDQIARLRIGAVFSAKGMRDNDWSDAAIRIPSGLPNPDYNTFLVAKEAYHEALGKEGRATWQAARAYLPMSVVYGWSMSINYRALKGFCANRMKFCEQEDTCATAWLMAIAVWRKFPLLGSYLMPGCDATGECQYMRSYGLSNMFGCLFKPCGRHDSLVAEKQIEDVCEFNTACTDKRILEKQLGIAIPGTCREWLPSCYTDLSYKDRELIDDEVR